MYKKHSISILIIFVIVTSSIFVLKFSLHIELISSLLTVQAIFFGFIITAIATLYSKEYTKKLHSEEDKELVGQTQLQTLKQYFKFSIYTSLIIIISLVIIDLTKSNLNFSTINIYLKITLRITSSAILGLFVINVYSIALLIKILIRGLEEEAQKCPKSPNL